MAGYQELDILSLTFYLVLCDNRESDGGSKHKEFSNTTFGGLFNPSVNIKTLEVRQNSETGYQDVSLTTK